jgi:ferredoxin
LSAFAILLVVAILAIGCLMLAEASLRAHEARALWVSISGAAIFSSMAGFGFSAWWRRTLDSPATRVASHCLLGAMGLFIASLFIRSDYSIRDKNLRRDRPTNVALYDATKQPGNEILRKIAIATEKDGRATLTFSVFDVCSGKVTHRINRDGPVSEAKVEVTDRILLTERIKERAREHGAEVVGITELSPRFIFQKDNDGKPVHLTHRYAIVLGKGLNYRLASPSAPLPWSDYYSAIPEDVAALLSGRKVNTGFKIPPEIVAEYRDTLEFFSDGGRIAVELAQEIRELGFPARAHFGRWAEVQVLPLAIQAGLGEIGKNGLVISRKFGPRGSFPIVTTDLPLVPDTQEDLGIQEFCQVCNKCARVCPVDAVSYGELPKMDGIARWQVDGQKCWTYLKTNPKCMACTGACPYNKMDLPVHRWAVDLIARKSRVANWLLVRLDDLLGYGQDAFRLKEEAGRVLESGGNHEG